MLMRHMRMGIIMDIMIACCFIIALLRSSLLAGTLRLRFAKGL